MRTQIKHRGFTAELWAPPSLYTFSQAFSLINIWCWLVECATNGVRFQHLDERNLLHSVASSHRLWTCILKVLTGAIGLSLCCYALACGPDMAVTTEPSHARYFLFAEPAWNVRQPRTLHCLKRFFEGWVRFCMCSHFPEYPWIHTHAAASSATQADACWLHWWWIGSVQDVFCVLRKAHMPSTPSLSSFPSVALESVPMLRSHDLENYLIR